MPGAGKASDAGWIYHIPNKNRNSGPMGAPPASQIPGLSQLPPRAPSPEFIRGMIKESDSAYVRLAKQGGRADLLTIRDPKPLPEKARGYPRVNWFYLEDNAREDAANAEPDRPKEPYQPSLPDYMVHNTYAGSEGQTNQTGQATDNDEYSPKRAPFQFDNKSAFQREGASITDKTIAIEEIIPVGHGVRYNKQKKQTGRSAKGHRGVSEESVEETDNRYQNVPRFDREEEKPNMSKIMSFGYVKDFEQKRKEWHEELDKKRSEEAEASEKKELEKKAADKTPKKSSTGKAAGDASRIADKTTSISQPKEPFKLSKFKNVPAKTNTNRNNQT